MFVTVMFGAGHRELVNPWCSLVNFTVHLKQKAQVPPEITIALLAEDGHLVKLEEEVTQAPSMACSLLQEQGTYVLVQAISKWGPRLSFAAVLHYKEGRDRRPQTHEDPVWHQLWMGVLSPTAPIQRLS